MDETRDALPPDPNDPRLKPTLDAHPAHPQHGSEDSFDDILDAERTSDDPRLKPTLDLQAQAAEEPTASHDDDPDRTTDETPLFDPDETPLFDPDRTADVAPKFDSLDPHSGQLPRTATGTFTGRTKRGRSGPADHIKTFGDYELLDEIARGGMGVVYKARQISLGRLVALKMILQGNFATDYAVRRFHIEAEAAAQINHPNVVPVFESGELDGLHFFSMQFVEGRSLSSAVRELSKDPYRAAAIVAKVSRAVHHAHQRGILHRDLKPSNVLLDKSGEPMVTDFGLAKIQGDDEEGMTMTGSVMGTPSYMAPEQAAGHSKNLTTAADIYGLGAILYDVISGQPPFKAETALATVEMVKTQEPRDPAALNPSLPKDLSTICLKCLRKEPSARYSSAEELALDLERFMRGEPVSARPLGRAARAVRWARRHPAVAALAAVAAGSAVLGLTGVLYQWNEAVQARRLAESRSKALATESARVKEQLHRAELLRGKLLLASGDSSQAERVLWSAALSSPEVAASITSSVQTRSPLPGTPAEWALWNVYRQSPRVTEWPAQARALARAARAPRLAGTAGGELTILKSPAGPLELQLSPGVRQLGRLALSADGSMVAAADYISGQVAAWQLGQPNPKAVVVLPPSGDSGTTAADKNAFLRNIDPAVVFLPDGRYMVGNRNGVKLCSAVGKVESSGRFDEVPDDSITLFPSPSQDVALAFVQMDATLRPITLSKETATSPSLVIGAPLVLNENESQRPLRARCMDVSADGQWIAFHSAAGITFAARTDGTSVVVVERKNSEQVPRLRRLSLSADAKMLAAFAEDDSTVYAWSFPELRLISSFTPLGGASPTDILALDQSQVAVSEGDGTAGIYQAAAQFSGQIKSSPTMRGSSIVDVATTGPGASVEVGRRTPVQFWTDNRVEISPRENPSETGQDIGLRITPDGHMAAVLTNLSLGPALEVAKPGAATRMFRIVGPSNDPGLVLALSDDGEVAAVGTAARAVVLSTTSGAVLREIPLPAVAKNIALASTGRIVVATHQGNLISVAADGSTWTLPIESSGLEMLFSQNGRYLAVPSGAEVVLIQAEEGRAVGTLVPQTAARPTCVGFSPGGRILATGSIEGRLGLWDLVTGEELAAVDLESGPLQAIAFSADSRSIRFWAEKRAAEFDLATPGDRVRSNLQGRLRAVISEVVARVGEAGAASVLDSLSALMPEAVALARKRLQP